MDLLAKLVLEPGRDPLSVRAARGHAANADEHEARGHHERGKHDARGPDPSRTEDREEGAYAGRDNEEHADGRANAGPVDRGLVWDRDGCELGELLGERASVETADRG